MNETMLISLLFLHGSLASLSTHIFRTSVENVDKKSAQRIYNVQWFNQTLDHFTFTTDAKFRQKYLVNDTYWNKWGYRFLLISNKSFLVGMEGQFFSTPVTRAWSSHSPRTRVSCGTSPRSSGPCWCSRSTDTTATVCLLERRASRKTQPRSVRENLMLI